MKIGDLNFLEIVLIAPPLGWIRGHCTIRTHDLNRPKLIVECWERGPFAVHPIEQSHDALVFSFARLTHKQGGILIGTFSTMRIAVEAAGIAEPLQDWESFTGREGMETVVEAWKLRYQLSNSFEDNPLMVYRPPASV
jgi:hypothetical protein